MKTHFIRKPVWHGRFYPAEKQALESALEQYLHAAEPEECELAGVIVPHAGYMYSGQIAGKAYAYAEKNWRRFERAVIIGPAHRVHLSGLACSSARAFATPLGEVEIDEVLRDRLKELPFVQEADDAHQLEHCIEVQLPFLQKAAGHFTFLPLLAGDVEPQEIATAIDVLLGLEKTLLVISSDLSHFYSSKEAKVLDQETINAVEALAPAAISSENACGYRPVQGCLLAARKHDWQLSLIAAANSYDTSRQDPERVVGYASFIAIEKRRA